MKIPSIFIFCALLISISVSAQHPNKNKLRFYHKNPEWIHMMGDSSVNYYEAKIAFEEFWRNKEKPEERETDEKSEEKSFFVRLFQNTSDSKKYSFEFKQFENWLRIKAPYVKSDGTLMTDDEYLELINEELRRRKEDALKF